MVDPGRLVNEPVKFDPGVTVKYGITPTVTLDFALNPDFAQVEADQTVVTANQRFPIFFEEKRPFFLEGIDIFRTPIQAVHTRAIVDPDVAVKLTGKRDATLSGCCWRRTMRPAISTKMIVRCCATSGKKSFDPTLSCDFENIIDKNAYIGVLRLKRDVGKENNIGLLATSLQLYREAQSAGGL